MSTPSSQEELFDPIVAAEKFISANLDSAVFTSIDDRDIKQAPNFFEFCHNSEFLAMQPGPYPRQMCMALIFFGEFCPKCSKPDFIYALPVDASYDDLRSNITLLEYGVCPKCKSTQIEMFGSNELMSYDEFNLCAGQRSGKSALTGIIFLYHLHRFLKIPNPARLFGLMSSSTFHMLLIAFTAGSIQQNIWDPFIHRMITTAPWFTQYHAFLNDYAKKKGIKPIYSVKDTFIEYDHKGIILSYAGADFRKLRGKTRIACVTGDTFVWTEAGLKSVGDIAKENPMGFSRYETIIQSQDGPQKTSHLFRSPSSRIVKIRTEHGYALSGTLNHPVRTLSGQGKLEWTQLDAISIGTSVVLKRGNDVWPKSYWSFDRSRYPVVGQYSCYSIPDFLDDDLGWFFGIMTAEGNTYWKDATYGWFGLASADQEVIDKVVKTTERAFGKQVKVEPIHGSKAFRLRTQSPRLAKLLIDAGLTGHSNTKVVPFSILSSPRSVQAAFLRGYFDGDAYGDEREITVTSASFELHRQIHIMLLGFGVVSNLTSIKNDGKTYSAIRINGGNIDKFNSVIGFSIPRKRKTKDVSRQDGQWDKVYLDCEFFKEHTVHDRIGVFNSRFKTVNGIEYRVRFEEFNAFMRTFSRHALSNVDNTTLSVIDSLSGSDLIGILERHDLFFDRVVSIKYDEAETFDFTVPESHSFIANGIVNHNTAIDEVGWFDAEAVKAGVKTDVKGQYDALINSLETVRIAVDVLRSQNRNWIPTGISCNISSPSSANDMIMRLVRKENPRAARFHFPTWEINPTMPYKAFKHREQADKKSFDRDFRAEPPMAASAYMDDENAVKRARSNRPNLINWNLKRETDKENPSVEMIWLDAIPARTDRNTPRILAVDAGESNNSFALVVASWQHDKQSVLIDGVLECQPEQHDDGSVSRVSFPMMFDKCIAPLIQKLNIKLVVSDRWQSTDLLQRVKRDFRTRSEAYTMRPDDFNNVKAAWYDGRILVPKTERDIDDVKKTKQQVEDFIRGLPVLKLLYQAMTVRQVGMRVVKPVDGSDDIFRAAALASRFLLDPETNRVFIYSGGAGAQSPNKSVGTVRTFRNKSGMIQGQVSASNLPGVGIRKGRLDPTGLVTRRRR